MSNKDASNNTKIAIVSTNMDESKTQSLRRQMETPEEKLRERQDQQRKRASVRRDSVQTDSGTSNPHENEEGILLPGRKRTIPISAINARDRSGRTLIYKYASRGDVDTCELLLKSGATLRISDYAGWTPLHEACLEGHVEIVRMMLSCDAEVNALGGDGDTPLHDAIGNCHIPVVEVLLEFGASLQLLNESNQTVIEFALERLSEARADKVKHIN